MRGVSLYRATKRCPSLPLRSLADPASPLGLTELTPVSHAHRHMVVRPGGGRSSVSGVVATVFGATGFIGQYVVNLLGRMGSQIVVPYRGDGLNARHLKVLGDLGQVVPVPFDPVDEESIARSVSRSNIVINLVGSEFDTLNYSIRDTNVHAVHRIAKVCKQAGVETFIHMSALGGSPDASSEFLRTKHEGETRVRSYFPDASILRPANIFGDEDRFVNRLASLLVHSPIVAIPGAALTHKVQPVYALDVAQALVQLITNPSMMGKTYELAGPNAMTLAELVEDIQFDIYRDNRKLFVNDLLAGAIGRIAMFGRKRQKVWTPDLIAQLNDNVTPSGQLPGLLELGIKPTPLNVVAPSMLLRFRGRKGEQMAGNTRVAEIAVRDEVLRSKAASQSA